MKARKGDRGLTSDPSPEHETEAHLTPFEALIFVCLKLHGTQQSNSTSAVPSTNTWRQQEGALLWHFFMDVATFARLGFIFETFYKWFDELTIVPN